MKSTIESKTYRVHRNVASHLSDICADCCRKLLAQIQSMKANIVAEFRGRLDEHDHMLELAINEADALAWQSGFPQLLFPLLATEKAQSVAQWHARQQFMREQSLHQAAG